MISSVYSGACARVGNQVIEPPPNWGNLNSLSVAGWAHEGWATAGREVIQTVVTDRVTLVHWAPCALNAFFSELSTVRPHRIFTAVHSRMYRHRS